LLSLSALREIHTTMFWYLGLFTLLFIVAYLGFFVYRYFVQTSFNLSRYGAKAGA